VGRRAVLVVAEGERPHPWCSYGRRVYLGVRSQRAQVLLRCDDPATCSMMAWNWVRVFMLVPIFGPNPDSLPSPFGQGAGVP
jgi:hypothetical protein